MRSLLRAFSVLAIAMRSSRSHDAVVRVYDDAGNVIATHEHKSDLSDLRWNALFSIS